MTDEPNCPRHKSSRRTTPTSHQWLGLTPSKVSSVVPSTWNGPVSNGTSTLTFTQPIAATDALRTGAYAKTLVFTLSTTNP